MPVPRFHATPDGTASAGMQAAYARDGFLIVEGFKTPEECDALRRRTHELVEASIPLP
jgi:phytanoyl-CoA hydroxylase